MKAIKDIQGLDWGKIEQEYVELLNPKVDSIVKAITDITKYLYKNKSIFLNNPNKHGVREINRIKICAYLKSNSDYIKYLSPIEDITKNNVAVIKPANFVRGTTLRTDLLEKYDIDKNAKFSEQSIYIKISDYDYIKRPFYSKLSTIQKSSIKSLESYIKSLITYFKDNLVSILLAKTNSISSLPPRYTIIIKNPNLKPVIKDFFEDYLYQEWLRTKYGHWFANVLGIKACPYCNNQWVLSVDTEIASKKVDSKFEPNSAKYELDHILSKSEYPYLAVSLYNLIPSCRNCNGVKSTKKGFFNPYFDSFHDKAKFKLLDSSDNPIWDLSNKNKLTNAKLKLVNQLPQKNPDNSDNTNHIKVETHKNTFALEGIYDLHKDLVEEIFWKVRVYGKYGSLRYKISEWLIKNLGIKLSDKDFDRFIYGTYLNENDFHKRIHTKLHIDIIEELEKKP